MTLSKFHQEKILITAFVCRNVLQFETTAYKIYEKTTPRPMFEKPFMNLWNLKKKLFMKKSGRKTKMLNSTLLCPSGIECYPQKSSSLWPDWENGGWLLEKNCHLNGEDFFQYPAQNRRHKRKCPYSKSKCKWINKWWRIRWSIEWSCKPCSQWVSSNRTGTFLHWWKIKNRKKWFAWIFRIKIEFFLRKSSAGTSGSEEITNILYCIFERVFSTLTLLASVV